MIITTYGNKELIKLLQHHTGHTYVYRNTKGGRYYFESDDAKSDLCIFSNFYFIASEVSFDGHFSFVKMFGEHCKRWFFYAVSRQKSPSI